MVRAALDADRADQCRLENGGAASTDGTPAGCANSLSRFGDLRGVIKELDRLYAGLGEHLEEETAFVIDGAIHETAYFQPIRPGCKVFSSPRLRR